MRDIWPTDPHEGFGADAFEYWHVFNGLLPGGAWSFIPLDIKAPTRPRWVERSHDTIAENVERLRGWRDNIGYPCGLQPGGWHLVIVDYDPRTEGADESLMRLRELGLSVRTVTTITGGEVQGQHLWYRSDVPVRKGSIPGLRGIDILAEGAQAVLPPSMTAHRYEFEFGWALDGTDIVPLHPSVLALVAAERPSVHEHDAPDALREARKLLERLGFHTYIEHNDRGTVWAEMTRPGKDYDGRGSVTIGRLGNPSAVHLFSTNGPMPAGPYDLAQLRVLAGEPAPERRIIDAIPMATPSVIAREEPPPEPPVPLDVIPALPEFPVHVFPDWLRVFAEQTAHAMQTPVDLPAMIILAALAAAAGGRMIAVPRSGWEEPTNLFVAVAMPPASRKSPVFRLVVEPLRLAEKALIEGTRESIAAAKAEKAASEQRARTLLNEAAKATGDDAEAKRAEAVAAQLLADAINVPTLPRILASDATPEALVSLLATYGGRIAVMSAEGGVFDQIAGRYTGRPALDVYLNGHAGDALHVDRIGRPPEYIARPALTIGITTQPSTFKALARVGDIKGRGLIGRFLWVLPPDNIGERDIATEPVEAAVRDTYTERMRVLAESLAGWESDPYRLTFMPDAGAALRVWERDVEHMLAPGGALEHVREWGGKLVGTTVRIASLLHLASHEGDHWRSAVVGAHVHDAVEVARYLTVHALAVFALMGAEPAREGAHTLWEWCRGQPDGFTLREAHRAFHRRFRTSDEVGAALDVLVDHGYLDEVPSVRRGQRRFVVAPGARDASTWGGDSGDGDT